MEVIQLIDSRPPPRRFRIADALILTAAIAAALAGCRVISQYSLALPFKMAYYVCAMGFSVTWTIALLVAFDSSPIRDAAKSPGKLAVLLITGLSVVTALLNWHLFIWIDGPLSDQAFHLLWETILQPTTPGVATIAGWLTRALTKTQSSSSDWLEYAGRLLGGFWVVFAFLSPLLLNQILREALGWTMS